MPVGLLSILKVTFDTSEKSFGKARDAKKDSSSSRLTTSKNFGKELDCRSTTICSP